MKNKIGRWDSNTAFEWYNARPWLVGVNYVPSYACNTTEWWQDGTDDSVLIDRELGWAEEIGYNTIRVFLQYMVWRHDPNGFKKRFSKFLDIAASHQLSVMPVLFDDCAFGQPLLLDPYPGKQRDPIPGIIMPCWTPSPGRKFATDPGEQPWLKKYVQDMLQSFNEDTIVMWDLYNEPMNEAAVGTPDFLQNIFAWARESATSKPITVGVWNDNQSINEVIIDNSDIITFHAYTDASGMKNKIAEMKKYGYPRICTEWMARVTGSSFEKDLPIFQQENVGCYQWGLVNGRTQCQFPWSNKPGGKVDETTGWFHDILHIDGTPYRQEEIDAIKRLLQKPV
jgi:hypothetical protein